jgi:ribose transport system permease protein
MSERNMPRTIQKTPRQRGLGVGLRSIFKNHAPLAVLLILCLVTGALSNRFLSTTNITNVLLQASVMAVVAMGMTFVIISGGFDLSVGSIVAMSGCAAAAVMLELGVVAGVVAGVAVGVGVGIVNGIMVSRFRLNPFIATLATMVVGRGLVLLFTDARSISGENGLPEAFIDYGLVRFLDIPLLTWTPIILFLALWWLLHQTAYGKRLFATGGNSEAAFLAGIAVDRVRASAYVWSGTLAGIAGVMLASRLQSGQPTAGEFYELTAIAAVVLGGASLFGGEGKLSNTIFGVLIMVVLSNALNLLNVNSYWQRIAVGSVIAAAAVLDQSRHRRS